MRHDSMRWTTDGEGRLGDAQPLAATLQRPGSPAETCRLVEVRACHPEGGARYVLDWGNTDSMVTVVNGEVSFQDDLLVRKEDCDEADVRAAGLARSASGA